MAIKKVTKILIKSALGSSARSVKDAERGNGLARMRALSSPTPIVLCHNSGQTQELRKPLGDPVRYLAASRSSGKAQQSSLFNILVHGLD